MEAVDPHATTAPRHDRWRTAILALDLQRDFLGEEARMPVAPGQIDEILAATNAIAEAAAAHDVPVVFIGNEFPASQWILNALRNRAALAGTRGAELDPRVKVVRGSTYFPKWASDAFSNPALEAWMRRNEVGRVVVLGVFAPACVRQTVRGAIHRGYAAHVVSDGVGAKTDAARAQALARLAKDGAAVVTAAETIALLASGRAHLARPVG